MSRKKAKKPLIAVAKVVARDPVRNRVAANPLLGKSQAHGKTRKATRRADKVSLTKMSFERIACTGSEPPQALGSNDIAGQSFTCVARQIDHHSVSVHRSVA